MSKSKGVVRRLKLRHIDALLTIQRCGSVTAAAKEMSSGQASVSQWLAEIEEAFGVRLYERGRQLTPTAFLPPVLAYCQRTLDDLERTEREVHALVTGQAGMVRIGFQHGVGLSIVPRAVLRIKAESPQTLVELRDDIAATLWTRFLSRQHDIVVARLHADAFADGFGCEPLFSDVHTVVASPRHPLCNITAPSWRDARAYPWLLPPAGTALRRCIDDTFISAGEQPPQPCIVSSAVATNINMLANSEMLMVISLGMATSLAARGDVALLPLPLLSEPGPFGMVWHAREPSAALLHALQALRIAAREELDAQS